MQLEEKDIKQMKTWVKALKSGKYSQTKSALQNKHGFCCLGVACKVVMKRGSIQYGPDSYTNTKKKYILGGMPHSQDNAPQWLKDINSDFDILNKKGFSGQGNGFVGLNDGQNQWTFKEIAVAVQATYLDKEITEKRLNKLLEIHLKRK